MISNIRNAYELQEEENCINYKLQMNSLNASALLKKQCFKIFNNFFTIIQLKQVRKHK